MTIEFLGDCVRFAASSFALMQATAADLLEGIDLNVEKWQGLAHTYEELVLRAKAISTDISSDTAALGQFVRIFMTSSLEDTIEILRQIPKDFDYTLPHLLGEAIVAKRRAELQQQALPTEQYEYLVALYALISYSRSTERYILALKRMLVILRHLLEFFAQQHDLSNASPPASMFVALSNVLASYFNIGDYIEQALHWGEKVLLASASSTTATGQTLRTSTDNIVLSNNLVNTCSWLMQQAHSDSRVYYEKGLAFATYLRKAVGIAIGTPVTFEEYVRVQELCIHTFILLHMKAALVMSEQFNTYAEMTCKYMQEFASLAEEYADPDLWHRFSELQQKVYQRLQEARPEWVAPAVYLEDSSQSDFQASDEYDKLLEQAEEVAKEIASSTDPAVQRDLLEKFLDSRYSELASWLSAVISEVGLNLHVCRIILGLGAIASGRIGDLTPEAVVPWSYLYIVDKSSLSSYGNVVVRRQQLTARKSFKEEKKLMPAIIVLALFTLIVQEKPGITSTLSQMLHKQNVILLHRVLSQNTLVQHLEMKLQPKVNDLALLLRGFSAQAKILALKNYETGDS